MIRCFNAGHVQDAIEDLLVNKQDQVTVNIALRALIPAPHDHYNVFKLVKPDRNVINLVNELGDYTMSIIDNGNGKFTCYATIQVEIEVKPENYD